ncbi:MAG: hypothetical protein K9L61_00620 [Candidatus Omnitrophica bacterium]|nr:hypothetical protein [Candidatus Omnitrophota bacterium]
MFRKGESFAGYVIILAVVIGSLAAMQSYVKRGVQAKVADISDSFLGPSHLAEVNTTESQSETTKTNASTEKLLPGQVKKYTVAGHSTIESETTVFDPTKVIGSPSSSPSTVTRPPTYQQPDNPQPDVPTPNNN